MLKNAQYIIRNAFSLAKLSYIENTGTVIFIDVQTL
jgi:hypothetical protein